MLVVGRLPLPPARSELTMSRSKTRPVVLSPAERNALTRLVRTGSHPAQQVRRARTPLELEEGDPHPQGPAPLHGVPPPRGPGAWDNGGQAPGGFAHRGRDRAATGQRENRAT